MNGYEKANVEPKKSERRATENDADLIQAREKVCEGNAPLCPIRTPGWVAVKTSSALAQQIGRFSGHFLDIYGAKKMTWLELAPLLQFHEPGLREDFSHGDEPMPVRTKKPRPAAPEQKSETVAIPTAVAPLPTNVPELGEQPHLGDWLAFYGWIACFLLMLAMNGYDLLRVLINR